MTSSEVSTTCPSLDSHQSVLDLFFKLGSCHKVWNRGGRKGFDRVIKIIAWKCWASKLLQVTNMGHEAIFVSRFAFNVLQLF